VVKLTTWRWEFYGFQSDIEGRPVQAWFDSLSPEDRDEIVDLLDYVRNTTNKPWPEKVFDPLAGEGGISEIKMDNIRCFREGRVKQVTYRIYGFFGPRQFEHSYTFLHGTEKEVRNDRIGKELAKGRLDEIRRGTARIPHKFEFQKRPDSAVEERPRRPS
jgi:hypothetical protein